MDKELFDDLLQSLKEAKAIANEFDQTINPFWLFLLIPALLIGFELGGYLLRHARPQTHSKEAPQVSVASPVSLPTRAPAAKVRVKEKLAKIAKAPSTKKAIKIKKAHNKPKKEKVEGDKVAQKTDHSYSNPVGSPSGLVGH